MKKIIAQTISDLVSDFLYYDRKEDEELPVGAIETEIKSGKLSIDDIVTKFREELEVAFHHN